MLNVQRDTSSVVPLAFTEKECTPFTPPRNGALVCATKSNTCAVMCRTGTDFESNPPFLYYCSSGVWKFFSLFPSLKAGTPGPNCAGKSLNVRDTLLYLYFPWMKGQCHENIFFGEVKTWCLQSYTKCSSFRVMERIWNNVDHGALTIIDGLVIFKSIFASFNLCPSLSPFATEDRKQFQCLNIVLNNKTRPLFLELNSCEDTS